MALSVPVPDAPRASGWRSAFALLALTLVAWGGVPGGSFQFDDRDSALVRAAPGLRIRPLLGLSWSMDQSLHGDRAVGWLAENLALHCLAMLLVLLLARRLLSPLGAFLAAAVFALQPANAEVVAYVSGRSTGLMAVLVLAALWVWRPDSRSRLLATGLLFTGAVAVKEVALVFPALLLVWARASEGPAFPVRRVVGFGALAGVLGLGLAAIPRYRALAGWSLSERGPLQSLALNLAALPEQLSLWFRPWALSVEHSVGPASSLVSGGLLLGGLLGVAWACRRRVPAVTLAIAWMLLALLPTQSVVAKADVLTEKPLYLAWVGPALLLGAGLDWGFSRLSSAPNPRRVLTATLVALAALATVQVRRRVEVWSTPRSLWTDAVHKAPGSSRAWNNLATALRDESLGTAVLAARRSVELDPSNGVALSNLANLEVLCPRGCSPE